MRNEKLTKAGGSAGRIRGITSHTLRPRARKDGAAGLRSAGALLLVDSRRLERQRQRPAALRDASAHPV